METFVKGKKVARKLSIIVISIIFSGCFLSSNPSEKEVTEKAFKYLEDVNKNAGSQTPFAYFSINNLKKTNGYMDGGTYIAVFDYDLINQVGYDEVLKDSMGRGNPENVNAAWIMDSTYVPSYHAFKPGDIVLKYRGFRIPFIKSEKGWVVR